MPIKIPTRPHPDFCECEACNEKMVKAQSLPCLCFDCETLAQDESKLLAMAPKFEPDSRLKDPEKIKSNLEKQRADYLEHAALNWKTAIVALIGVGDGKTYVPITGDEKFILESFFAIVRNSIANGVQMGGHGIKSFDLLMLVNRARRLKIELPEGMLMFWNGRVQWHELFFDTLEIFSFGKIHLTEGNGVDDICRALEIDGKTGDGSQFGAMWKADKRAAISYNENDIRCEVEIAKVCGFKFNK